jgi:deoxyribodipyrimidine photo-lyase
MRMTTPAIRVWDVNTRPVGDGADYVLYWMIAARRTRWNFGLLRAVEWAERLEKPVVIFEPLRIGYPWASERLHAFILQGMADNEASLRGSGVRYYPYVEREAGHGKGLLTALARRAAVVVTDDFPAFFLRRMVAAAARQVEVRLEAVDSNGLLPLRAAERTFATAYAFRSFLQKHLRPHLAAFPEADPAHTARLVAADDVPPAITRRWPAADESLLEAGHPALRLLPIDHAVGPVAVRGGMTAGGTTLQAFLDARLERYPGERNQPEVEATSGLSPYLHFGHVSVHEVFAALMTRERWTTRAIAGRATGKREGWWGASPAAEAFLDELVTWREVGHSTCHLRRDYDRYDSLPDWARATLDSHAADPRPHVYTLEAFEAAATHDPLWNAAQTQLVREGRMHNYLRMLWGKKVLEWSPSPRAALDVMIELNNKYALDGRDPNSYSGIFWVLGRYDRPWAPERPIFGTVRYMSSENTARKLRVKEYQRRYAP